MTDSKPTTAPPVDALTDIWRSVLDQTGLTEDSDIFEHGGNSLHALQIVGEVHDRLGRKVTLRQVFEHGSPRRLAAFLGG